MAATNTARQSASSVFEAMFQQIHKQISYLSTWADTQGGYSNATTDNVTASPGSMVKAVDLKGRKLLFVGVPGGESIVLYERVAGDVNGVISGNLPASFSTLFEQSRNENMSFEFVEMILGSQFQKNIGSKLQDYITAISK